MENLLKDSHTAGIDIECVLVGPNYAIVNLKSSMLIRPKKSLNLLQQLETYE
jgi:hypothetical protein